MHYINGRKACNGDPIVVKDHSGQIQVGILFDTNPGAETCNGMIQRPLGSPWAVTIRECCHAEDAYDALIPKITISASSGGVNLT